MRKINIFEVLDHKIICKEILIHDQTLYVCISKRDKVFALGLDYWYTCSNPGC